MSKLRSRENPIAEGFLAGIATLLVTIAWIAHAPFHQMIVFALYLVALFCLSLSTLWVLSREKTIKEWFLHQTSRYLIVFIIEIALMIVFFLAYSLK